MAENEKQVDLSKAGLAVWPGGLSRDPIRSGELQSLVDDHLALSCPAGVGAYLTLGW